jgi:hypothetical protein
METTYKNTLEKSKKYLDIILELFVRASITNRLDAESQQFDWMGADELKILKLSTTGLGDYKKDVGYPQGAITAIWEIIKLAQDRGARFLLDRVDNDEVMGLTLGRVAQNFVDYQMAPELDAYRFAQYAAGAGGKGTGTLNKGNILDAIDTAKSSLNKNSVPKEGRILFVNEDLETAFNGAINRQWSNESAINREVLRYNGMDILFVPPNRFHDEVILNSGEEDKWGYEPDGKEINFMLLYPKSIVQARKVSNAKFISADEPANEVDSNKFMFRIYHDAFVLDRYKDGVYVNTK